MSIYLSMLRDWLKQRVLEWPIQLYMPNTFAGYWFLLVKLESCCTSFRGDDNWRLDLLVAIEEKPDAYRRISNLASLFEKIEHRARNHALAQLLRIDLSTSELPTLKLCHSKKSLELAKCFWTRQGRLWRYLDSVETLYFANRPMDKVLREIAGGLGIWTKAKLFKNAEAVWKNCLEQSWDRILRRKPEVFANIRLMQPTSKVWKAKARKRYIKEILSE